MTFLERTTDVKRLRHVGVDMSVDYIYTSGIAGEVFFKALRDEGRILAVHCPVCKVNQLPPRMFCEGCFTELTEFVDVPAEGRVAAVTVAKVDRRGGPLPNPQAYAFVTFKGIQEGGLIHRLLVVPEKAKVGLAVRARLKPKDARTGTILDIEGFEPVASQA
ncbi:MAG TPA: nucleic acid-binding protein [Thermoplasmata archaeon]|nr:nucleic acid-binding protein [Thermoplasmata archaeon]